MRVISLLDDLSHAQTVHVWQETKYCQPRFHNRYTIDCMVQETVSIYRNLPCNNCRCPGQPNAPISATCWPVTRCQQSPWRILSTYLTTITQRVNLTGFMTKASLWPPQLDWTIDTAASCRLLLSWSFSLVAKETGMLSQSELSSEVAKSTIFFSLFCKTSLVALYTDQECNGRSLCTDVGLQLCILSPLFAAHNRRPTSGERMQL